MAAILTSWIETLLSVILATAAGVTTAATADCWATWADRLLRGLAGLFRLFFCVIAPVPQLFDLLPGLVIAAKLAAKAVAVAAEYFWGL